MAHVGLAANQGIDPLRGGDVVVTFHLRVNHMRAELSAAQAGRRSLLLTRLAAG